MNEALYFGPLLRKWMCPRLTGWLGVDGENFSCKDIKNPRIETKFPTGSSFSYSCQKNFHLLLLLLFLPLLPRSPERKQASNHCVTRWQSVSRIFVKSTLFQHWVTAALATYEFRSACAKCATSRGLAQGCSI